MSSKAASLFHWRMPSGFNEVATESEATRSLGIWRSSFLFLVWLKLFPRWPSRKAWLQHARDAFTRPFAQYERPRGEATWTSHDAMHGGCSGAASQVRF